MNPLPLIKDMLKTGPLQKLWLFLMFLYNGIMPLMFLEMWQARLTFICLLLSAVSMSLLHKRFGYSKILGLAHIYWIPMMVYILRNTILIEMEPGQVAWIYGLILVNITSLVIDIRDVIQFAKGSGETETKAGDTDASA